ncbi:MAG TPA: hypothetical protein DEA55_11375 [Rhodospirillaceae bacterium]|nr:hypothetical protein [Rhodospirillaceae bacterium]
MPTYNFSSLNTSYTGTGTNDILTFNNDTGIFDHKTFGFLKSGNDLLIYANNGKTVTITNHFLNNTTRYETLKFSGNVTIDLKHPSLIIGTSSNQALLGTANADLILGGDDSTGYILGNDGNDTIYAKYTNYARGGIGDDTIYATTLNGSYGDEGNDTIHITAYWGGRAWGGIGDDTIQGSAADDPELNGEDGDDTIYGNNGNDIILGANGNDTLYGGEGHDQLVENTVLGSGHPNLSYGNDRFYGGNGNDLIISGFGTDYAEGGAGNDNVYAKQSGSTSVTGIKTFYGGTGDDNLVGGIDGDFLYGENDNDYIGGDAGNDSLYGGAGIDTITGNQGNDYIDGGTGNDILEGNEDDDLINGNDGDDIIRDGAGNDELHGNAGNDTIKDLTGTGNDKLYGEDGNDQLWDTTGSNELYGGNGNDTYTVAQESGIKTDYIYDLTGTNDTLNYTRGNGSVTTFQSVGKNLVITVAGPGASHTITVDRFFSIPSFIETIVETYSGGSVTFLATENLTGSADIYTATSTTSPLGVDGNYVKALGGNDVVYLGAGSDVVFGGTGNDILYGEAGDDELFGDTDDDILIGGAGADSLLGSQGIDTADYSGSIGGVTVNFQTSTGSGGDAAGDTFNSVENITGSAYADTLTGSSGTNVLKGGDGNDTINGGLGDDVLYGEAGSDILTGGGGSDVFVYGESLASGWEDTVTDFSLAGNDKVELTGLLTGYDPLTDLISDFVQITDDGTNSFVAVDADGGADNFVQIITLQNVTGLTDEDSLKASGNLIIS